MRCLYCDEKIDDYSLYSLIFEEDKLCRNCRDKIKWHHKTFKIDDMEVETFYEYNSLFKSILLQYKECYDEALKDVFLYKIKDYIKIKYLGYKILYVPSSKKKLEERGFNHLKLMFEELDFKEVRGLRMINDSSQVSKGYSERLKMIDNYIYEGDKDLGKVLIVDDVYTTGSSIRGVYKAIKPYSKVVRTIVLCFT